jgi:hypothetical protein
LIAVPALVLAQATTTTTPAKAEATKVQSTTTPAATKTAPEAAKSATTMPTTPEMLIIGEITNVDNTNKYFTLKVKDTNKMEKVSFKETNPSLKNGLKIKATYERDASGNLWLKKFEEHNYAK